MVKSLVKGAIIGGVIAWVWSIISWMVIPWHQPLFHKFDSETYVGSILKENAPKKGVYLIPYMNVEGKNTKQDQKMYAEKIKNGPVVFAVVSPKGETPMGMLHFICALLTQAVGGALIGMILHLSCCKNYFGRVMISLFAGIFAGIVSFVPAVTWWHFPWDYVLVSILDLAIAWLIVGLVLATIIKPKKCCRKENEIPPPAT